MYKGGKEVFTIQRASWIARGRKAKLKSPHSHIWGVRPGESSCPSPHSQSQTWFPQRRQRPRGPRCPAADGPVEGRYAPAQGGQCVATATSTRRPALPKDAELNPPTTSAGTHGRSARARGRGQGGHRLLHAGAQAQAPLREGLVQTRARPSSSWGCTRAHWCAYASVLKINPAATSAWIKHGRRPPRDGLVRAGPGVLRARARDDPASAVAWKQPGGAAQPAPATSSALCSASTSRSSATPASRRPSRSASASSRGWGR